MSYLQALSVAGVGPSPLATALAWASSGDVVSLVFTATTKCELDFFDVREVDGGIAVREEVVGGFLGDSKKTVTTRLVNKFVTSCCVVPVTSDAVASVHRSPRTIGLLILTGRLRSCVAPVAPLGRSCISRAGTRDSPLTWKTLI